MGDQPRPRFCSGEQIKKRPQKIKGLHQNWNTSLPPIQVKTKKKSSPKMKHFFPRIQVNTYTQMYTRVKLLGDADVDHTQTIEGVQSNYRGD